MYRIDNSTATPTLPAPAAVGPNPNSYFTSGNPATGTPATIVDQDWANMVQEELCNAASSAGATLSKTNHGQLAAVLIGRLLNKQPFNSSGTYTPTPGTRLICVRTQGAGGAGGGTEAVPAGSISVGSGGASGSYAEAWFLVSSITSPVTITIGAAGFGGDGVGGAGGTTYFGPYIECPGGGGGLVTETPNTTAFAVVGQGLPGSLPALTGNITALPSFAISGQPGSVGLIFSGAGESGQGAVSRFGFGGPNTAGGAGNVGSGPGGGGGGAAVQSSGAAAAGGNGGPGYCEIEEYS